MARAARELQGSSARSIKSVEWSLSDGLIYFQGKIYVLDAFNLCRWIIALSHDSRLAGHSRRWKTLELVSRNYWWPQMSRYIGRYVSTCDMCLWTKSFPRTLTRELHPLPIPSAPWDTISVDFIIELPQSAGHDSIMFVVDSITKCTHLISTVTTISAAGAAHLFLNHVWKHHGLPQQVVSNRGPQFVAEFIRNSTGCSELSWQPPQPTTLRGMDRWKGLTRSLNNVSSSSPTRDKMIGWGSCHLQNSSITTRFILPPNILLSSLTLDVFPRWALSQTNLVPMWSLLTSSETG